MTVLRHAGLSAVLCCLPGEQPADLAAVGGATDADPEFLCLPCSILHRQGMEACIPVVRGKYGCNPGIWRLLDGGWLLAMHFGAN